MEAEPVGVVRGVQEATECMSWHFLPEVEGGSSAERSSVGRPLQRSRSTRSAVRCYCDDRSTACSPCSQSGTTRGRSMAGRGVGWWMSCLQASRASRSALRGSVSPTLTSETSGRRLHESLARYDPGSRSWRTCQGSLLPIETTADSSGQPTWERFWGPWPSWGTLRSGVCWERTTPALPTNGTACGFWPTPVASEVRQGWQDRTRGKRGTQESLTTRVIKAESRGGTGTRRTWRSPQARDHRNARAPGKWQSGERQPGLNDQVADKTATDTATRNGQLNPDWVEWLMGWPIGWTGLGRLGTDRFQQWLRQHGGF